MIQVMNALMESHAFAKYGIWCSGWLGQRAAGTEQVHTVEENSRKVIKYIFMQKDFQHLSHISVTKQYTQMHLWLCSVYLQQSVELLHISQRLYSTCFIVSSTINPHRWKPACRPSFTQLIQEAMMCLKTEKLTFT